MICQSGSAKLIASAILAIIIIGSLTLFAYQAENSAMQDAVKTGMKSVAGVMATQISPADLNAIKPGDENSPQYIAVAQKLRTLRSMDDKILNAYILKVSPDQTVTFLVDDLYPVDPQGSAKIGEVSTAPDKLDILLALSGPTTSKQPYTTKYGSFMTAYAPIDDAISGSSGNTYAVLAIDLSAKDYLAYTSQGGLILLSGFVAMIIAVGAIFLFGRSRNTRTREE